MAATAAQALTGARILVTGAGGFIGAGLVAALLGAGLSVDAMVSRAGIPNRLRPFRDHPGLRPVVWNLARNPARMLAREGYDLVFHLAARPPGQSGNRDFRRTLAVNAASPLEIAAAMEARGGRLVFTGSVAEFAARDTPMDEDTPAAPDTLYGLCKASAMLGLARLFPAGPWTGLRLFGVYGPGEARERLLPYIASRLVRGEPALLTSGEQVRDFVCIDDVVRALLAAAASPAARGRVYNIGSGQGKPVREVAELAGAMLGRPDLLRFGAVPYASATPRRYVADIGRALRELAWRPEVDLATGVRRTLDWHLERDHA